MEKFNFNLILQLKTMNRKNLRSSINFKKGIYYWFASTTALSKLRIDITPEHLFKYTIMGQDYYLVYIGIGPRSDQTKKQFIKQRIVNCHLGKNITNSTFRLSVASLLINEGYSKQSGKNLKFYLAKECEISLSSFIENEFCVCINEHESPWEIESNLIQYYEPPLNLEHNQNGWNYSNMKEVRGEFQRLARATTIIKKSNL